MMLDVIYGTCTQMEGTKEPVEGETSTETIMEVEQRPLEDYFPLQVGPAQLP